MQFFFIILSYTDWNSGFRKRIFAHIIGEFREPEAYPTMAIFPGSSGRTLFQI